jgi:diguanylate cyclase (GGDEF)-like protein/PAS domain S-box-containing protein
LAISGLMVGVYLVSMGASGDPAPDRKPIHALGDQDYPPITYLEDGTPRGFSVDVLRALGEIMGRDIRIELLPWDLAQKHVQEGKAEILAELSITEERRKLWDFASPTITHTFSLFVASGEVTIHGVDDLQSKRVGVTAGGFPRALLQIKPGVNLVVIANYEEGFDLLKKGGVDAIAADTWVGGYTLNKHRIEGIALAGQPFATRDAAIAVPKGNQALLQEINQGVEKLKQRGTIESIRQQWEPKQVVYLLKEEVRALVILAVGIAGLILFGGMTAWIVTLNKEVRVRKKTENQLRTSEALFMEISENVPEFLWLREVGSEQISYVSSAWERITGYPPPKSRSDFLRIIHPGDLDRVTKEAQDSPLGGVDHQYRIVRSDGSVRWLHVQTFAVRNGAGEIYRIGGTGADVTDEISRNQELRQFRAAVDASADLVTLIDPRRMRYVDVNDTTCSALGYSREELLAMSPGDVFSVPGSDLVKDYEGLIVGDQASSSVEGVYRCKDGSTFPVESFRRVVASDEGDIIVATARDITARKEAEEKIRRLNRVYAVLSGINALILRISDRQELFREVCRIAIDSGRFRMAWLGVIDGPAQKVKPVASAGDVTGFFESTPLAVTETTPGGVGLVGRAIREMKPMISNDVQGDPQGLMKRECEERGITSQAVIPLIVGDKAIGVLCLYAAEMGFFDDDEMRLLIELAGDISFALDHIEKGETIEYLAYYDSLTGLANRTLFHDRLAQTMAQAKRSGRPLAVLFIDLDRFKLVNDTRGHGAGDKLLKETATRLSQCVRSGDTVGRFGGDEFGAVLSGLGKAGDASIVAQKIIDALARPFHLDGHETYVSASVGITLFPTDGEEAGTLITNADVAMYRAKEQGRNNYQYFTPEMNERALARAQMEAALRRAIERGEFLLHYQPKADLQSGRICGFEALLRWQHPERGMVLPVEFIPVLEDAGLIVPVGEWVISEVCRQIQAWQRAGLAVPPVAVNLSARQFQQKDLETSVRRILREAGVDPLLLQFELTESLLMKEPEAAARTLRGLKESGVKISVDDFGTGYSSLAYLKRFPIDALKIDRAFIRDITTNPEDAAITLAIIGLAHSLKLRVVAEGVETEGQLNFLALHDCDEMQGYYFARPAVPAECEAMLRQGRRLNYSSDGAPAKPAVLLLDDSEQDLELLERILRSDGFPVLKTTDPRRAFELLASRPVGIVVSDQCMPEMTGVEFLSHVRKLYPDVMRVMATGLHDPRAAADAVNEAGIHKLLLKDWDGEHLRAELREVYRHHRPGADAKR